MGDWADIEEHWAEQREWAIENGEIIDDCGDDRIANENNKFEQWRYEEGLSAAFDFERGEYEDSITYFAYRAWKARARLDESEKLELLRAAEALSIAVENIEGDTDGVGLYEVYEASEWVDDVIKRFNGLEK